MTSTRQRRPRKPKPLTKPILKRMAVRYLERFPASEAHFRQVMQRQIKRHHQRAPGEETEYESWLQEVQAMCRRIGLLNDEQLCNALATSFSRRGYSLKDIRRRLQHKRFSHDVIEGAVSAHLERMTHKSSLNPDVGSALRYVKKRRMGPFATKPVDWDLRRRHLARLARRGFSYSAACDALDMSLEDATAHLRELDD